MTNHDNGEAVSGPEPQSPDEILEYWTEERRQSAVPVEQIVEAPEQGPAVEGAPAWERPDRTPEEIAPSPPEGAGDDPVEAAERPELLAFRTFKVLAPTFYPQCTVGRLFVTFGGRNGSGSASVVNQKGLITAAHCLYDHASQSWATNVLFCPGYANGPSEYGSWPVGQMFANAQWLSGKNYAWDFAMCRVPARGGKEIGAVVGTLGLKVNTTDRQWTTEGYPNIAIPGYDFNGTWMWACEGAYTRTIDLFTVGKEGNLTQGSSGGPWTVDKETYVNGVQSHANPSYPNENFSPYFDTAVTDLYRQAFP